MSQRRTIPIAAPATDERELAAIRAPLESGWLAQGPQVQAFETRFAEQHQVPHAVAVSSGTAGLHLVLLAWGLGPGDEVIVPAFTWVATANVVRLCGATPVFADVRPDTYNLDPTAVQARLSPRTRVVIPVHLFGRCADVDALQAVLPAGVRLLEDAACAAGARYGDRWAGALGDAAVFSFHPRKTITTGEGGMITTADAGLAERLRRMRNHGASPSDEERRDGPQPHLLPEFEILGTNYRMTDLQGALGVVQLAKLDGFIRERARWAAFYRQALAGLDWLATPQEPPHGRHGWQAFVTRVRAERSPLPRNALMARLQDRGIATRPGTHAVPALAVYREAGVDLAGAYPVALDSAESTLALPLHNRMGPADYDHVVAALREL